MYAYHVKEYLGIRILHKPSKTSDVDVRFTINAKLASQFTYDEYKKIKILEER